MASFIKITFGLAASSLQADLVQLVKSLGDEAIQTSDGLCVRSSQGIEKLQTEIKNKNWTDGIQMQNLDPSDASLAPDIKAFIAGS